MSTIKRKQSKSPTAKNNSKTRKIIVDEEANVVYFPPPSPTLLASLYDESDDAENARLLNEFCTPKPLPKIEAGTSGGGGESTKVTFQICDIQKILNMKFPTIEKSHRETVSISVLPSSSASESQRTGAFEEPGPSVSVPVADDQLQIEVRNDGESWQEEDEEDNWIPPNITSSFTVSSSDHNFLNGSSDNTASDEDLDYDAVVNKRKTEDDDDDEEEGEDVIIIEENIVTKRPSLEFDIKAIIKAEKRNRKTRETNHKEEGSLMKEKEKVEMSRSSPNKELELESLKKKSDANNSETMAEKEEFEMGLLDNKDKDIFDKKELQEISLNSSGLCDSCGSFIEENEAETLEHHTCGTCLCPECGSVFNNRDQLKAHYDPETNECIPVPVVTETEDAEVKGTGPQSPGSNVLLQDCATSSNPEDTSPAKGGVTDEKNQLSDGQAGDQEESRVRTEIDDSTLMPPPSSVITPRRRANNQSSSDHTSQTPSPPLLIPEKRKTEPMEVTPTRRSARNANKKTPVYLFDIEPEENTAGDGEPVETQDPSQSAETQVTESVSQYHEPKLESEPKAVESPRRRRGRKRNLVVTTPNLAHEDGCNANEALAPKEEHTADSNNCTPSQGSSATSSSVDDHINGTEEQPRRRGRRQRMDVGGIPNEKETEEILAQDEKTDTTPTINEPEQKNGVQEETQTPTHKPRGRKPKGPKRLIESVEETTDNTVDIMSESPGVSTPCTEPEHGDLLKKKRRGRPSSKIVEDNVPKIPTPTAETDDNLRPSRRGRRSVIKKGNLVQEQSGGIEIHAGIASPTLPATQKRSTEESEIEIEKPEYVEMIKGRRKFRKKKPSGSQVAEPTFDCNFCTEKFAAETSLMEHIVTFHCFPKHDCDQCPASFQRPKELHLHKVKNHPDPGSPMPEPIARPRRKTRTADN